MKNDNAAGHLLASLTVLLWGTTFVSTKVLLENDFSPLEILFYRFVLGTVALILIYPHFLKGTTLRQEFVLATAGLFGVTLYYLLENIALDYTFASNVALIASLAPFFTMVLAYWFLKEEQLKPAFFAGFLISITGIALISFNGSTTLEFNLFGDFLALLAGFTWAVYSILCKKISAYGFNTIQTTQRTFMYGLCFMLLALPFLEFNWRPALFLNPVNSLNLIFLGLGASAMCFVTWNLALKRLGAIKVSFYIYLVPVITVIASIIVLHEHINWMSGTGIVLTLSGLLISKIERKKKHISPEEIK